MTVGSGHSGAKYFKDVPAGILILSYTFKIVSLTYKNNNSEKQFALLTAQRKLALNYLNRNEKEEANKLNVQICWL